MAEEKEKKPAKVGPKATAAMTKDEPKKEKPAKAPEKKSEKKDSKKKKKHKFGVTHIEHHTDGSHTVRHVPEDGGQEMSYASPDLNGVKAGLDQNLGEPEGDEGTGTPAAAPAPAPAAPAPNPQMGV